MTKEEENIIDVLKRLLDYTLCLEAISGFKGYPGRPNITEVRMAIEDFKKEKCKC